MPKVVQTDNFGRDDQKEYLIATFPTMEEAKKHAEYLNLLEPRDTWNWFIATEDDYQLCEGFQP